jgi:hypothetical protein
MNPSLIRRLLVGSLVATLLLSIGWVRWQGAEIPHDTASYVAAADLFASGADPYQPRQIIAAERNRGFLYIYPPMSLYLIWPLSQLSTPSIALIEITARSLALLWIAWALTRRFLPHLHLVYALALLLCTLFIRGDLFDGNVGTFMFALWLLIASWLPDRSHVKPWLAASLCLLCGALFALKPLWVPTAAAALAARNRWAWCAALATGAALCTLASALLHGGSLWSSWLDVLTFHRAYYSRDEVFLTSWWWLAPAALLWAAASAWLLRRGDPDSRWIWAGALVMVWPRYGLYDLQLLLPALCWLATQLDGWRRWALLLATILIPQLLLISRQAYEPWSHIFVTTRLLGWALLVVFFLALRRQTLGGGRDQRDAGEVAA